jgi:hypothetical protein
LELLSLVRRMDSLDKGIWENEPAQSYCPAHFTC